MAIAMVLSLCNAVRQDPRYGDPEAIRGRLAGDVVSTETMRKILEGAVDPGANRDVFVEGLTKILDNLDDTHVPVVLEKIEDITEPVITSQLIDYLARKGRGHEEALGAMFEGATVELGLALVRVLAAIGSPEARQAASMAAHSPHPVVRIEALGHVEGVSSERLRIELRGLIEDHEASVRLAALQAMEHHNIRVAGPFLVLRIKSEAFDKLPFEERNQALSTLATLAPNRAEPVCLELLNDQRMVSSEAHEQTRAAAAEMLGRISSSRQVIAVLEDAATKRWRSSERVRSAAKAAMEQVGARIARTLQPSGGG
jgi:HEAT repeat protein